MSDDQMVPFQTLRFIGRMNAHLSHDIKNVTATVSETAGLLEDLLAMQASGKPVDPQRFSKLSARIIQQVERGDKLLANMNILAHSTDEPLSATDMNKTLKAMAEMARCVPYYRQVDFTASGDEPVVTTRPYVLEQFIYTVYRAVFKAMPQDDALSLCAEATENGCNVILAGLPDTLDEDAMRTLRALADILGGETTHDSGRLELRLPGR